MCQGGSHEAGVCLGQESLWSVPAALGPLCFLRGYKEGPQDSARMLNSPLIYQSTDIVCLGQIQPRPPGISRNFSCHPETEGLIGGVGRQC